MSTIHYVDKAKKDSLWEEIGEQIGRSGLDVKRWFQTQCTRYGKLTSDLNKSGSGKNFQMTERTKWVLTHFKFLDGHIMRRATVETAGFSQPAASATSPNESRGSVTDVESTMESSGHGLSQQPSFPQRLPLHLHSLHSRKTRPW